MTAAPVIPPVVTTAKLAGASPTTGSSKVTANWTLPALVGLGPTGVVVSPTGAVRSIVSVAPPVYGSGSTGGLTPVVFTMSSRMTPSPSPSPTVTVQLVPLPLTPITPAAVTFPVRTVTAKLAAVSPLTASLKVTAKSAVAALVWLDPTGWIAVTIG